VISCPTGTPAIRPHSITASRTVPTLLVLVIVIG